MSEPSTRPEPPKRNPFVQANFLMSCSKLSQCPSDGRSELAFAGRSNSGKSSALNALCGRKGLARVSKTPGRTQLINLFDIPENARLVDLPGYGYAKVSASLRQDWAAMVGEFVEKRQPLMGIVLIMDCRHPLTDYDLQMLAWVRQGQRRCHILLTKADKLGFGAAKNTLLKVQKDLKGLQTDATVQLWSSTSGQGVEQGRDIIWKMFEPVA
tara:strand:- start:3302 stop:3937 length:636 start_codon:yes stop_codon:yes gene_type:complete